MTSPNPHVLLLERAAKALAPLQWEFVFVGGATISLYLDDAAAADIRATEDVDCVVSVTTYTEYARVEQALRDEGCTQLLEDEGPICRWSRGNLLLDILPADPALLGFSESRWFREGFAHARTHTLPSGTTIKLFELPYLFAAKIEAYEDRADGDYLSSKDFEDIASLLDGRSSIFDELSEDGDIYEFIREWFGQYDLEQFEEMLGSSVRNYQRGKWLADGLSDVLDS